jgi:hypothetical protein
MRPLLGVSLAPVTAIRHTGQRVSPAVPFTNAPMIEMIGSCDC